MVKVFTQRVDLASANTITRDSTTLENLVNGFIQRPGIIPQKTNFFEFTDSGNIYYTILLDYNIKQGA